jgi:hypothetical protein
MLIFLYLFLGLLFFNCLIICCLYLFSLLVVKLQESPSKQYEEQLKDLKTEESTQYSKAA